MPWHGWHAAVPRHAPRFGRVRSQPRSRRWGDPDPDKLSTESAPCFSAPAMSVNLVLSPGRPWRLAALGRGHTEAERCLPASPVATMPTGGAARHELDATRPCEGALDGSS